MGMVHLSFEELSALFDGELSAQADSAARQHLRACPDCSAEYSLNARLERNLRQPPVLSCDSVLELLSASFDDQASAPDRAVAERHLGSCVACRAEVEAWGNVGYLLKTLPAGRPSARVDEAIARMTNPPRRVGTGVFPRLAPRLAIAGAAVVAVILGGLPLAQTPGPTPALQQPESDRVIVAAAQQIVYNAKNNTLYVLDTATAAVDAREPGTNDLKQRIPVGGEPIRLALNESANTILVLDAAQKRVTEIDAASNTVISAKTVDVAGTPTSINVDTTGKIHVYSVPGPAASTALVGTAPGGTVSVLDGTTKQLETVRDIDVAPRMVVVDPLSNQAVLVSSEITKLVDSSYKVIGTMPGGVAAAFSRKGDGVAVLSPAGVDTTINFAGALAPTALKLQGSPRAITALKEGGYLVLLQVNGQGRVVKVSADGRAEGSISVAVAGGDLLYDEATNFFTVANGGTVASAQVPVEAARADASASPTASATPLAAPSASSSPIPTAAPPASAEPARSPAPSPVIVAVPSPTVLNGAKEIAPGLYSAALPSGVKPHLMAASGSRIWFVDQASRVAWFDMNTGETKTVAKLRADARVGYWVAGRSFVFGVDSENGQVHVVNTVTESVDSFATNVLSPVSAVAVGLDDRLWLGLREASYLLAWDPRTRGVSAFDLGDSRVTALAIDRSGRVVYSDDVHGRVGTLDSLTTRLLEVPFARRGSTTALIVDRSGTIWLGTSSGALYSIESERRGLAKEVRMPVSALALDETGRAWYLAPMPNGIAGFAFAPANGPQGARSIPGPASGLAFSEAGQAFLADPRGALYMATPDGR
jgi:anti-sigma factor RsiW/streptogramin lyase